MELHIETLARSLFEKGEKVTVITTAHPLGIEIENKYGVEIHYLAGTCPGKYSRQWWKKSVKKFEELHAVHHFDVIHSQSAGASHLLRKHVHEKYHIPVVTTLHGTAIDEIKTKLRLGFSIRTMLGLIKNIYDYLLWDRTYIPLSNAIIATSDSQVSVITKWYPVDFRKVHLVYNGIDVNAFTPHVPDGSLRTSIGLAPSDFIILSVARLKEEKGIQNILTVLPALIRDHPTLKLLVGGEGEYKNELIALVERLALTKHVYFLGKIDYNKLPEYFNLCEIFVNPTVRENGYDLTIPQAMACAKPVVVSDIRSVVASVVEDKKNGFIYPRNDLDRLKKLVDELIRSQKLREAIGRNARDTARKKFSLEAMADKTIAIYRKICERKV
jgi:glycosyltransferase involved in cell wall biosynthesis